MSSDWNYYYDFEKEQKIAQWKKRSQNGNQYIFESQFECENKDDYVILVPFPRLLNDADVDSDAPVYLQANVNGKEYSFRSDIVSAYIGKQCARQGLRIHLAAGTHLLQITLSYS